MTLPKGINDLLKTGQEDNIELALTLSQNQSPAIDWQPYWDCYAWLQQLTLVDEEVLGSNLELLLELSNINSIIIENTSLDFLPQHIHCLIGLDHFQITGGKFHTLPPSMVYLEKLEHLALQKGDLEYLPDNLEGWSNLERLFLNDNRLGNIPKSIARLQRLQQLELSNNQLRQLPKGLGQLKTLRYLSLGGNPIQLAADSFTPFKQLQVLLLADLNLSNEGLPPSLQDLTQLEELDLSNNALTYLPTYLTNLPKLRYLDLRNNPLVKKDIIPASLHHNPTLNIFW